MSEHSVISPSSFERIYKCPASLRLGLNIKDTPPSLFAEEGTMMHEKFVEFVQNKLTHDESLDSEQLNAIQICLDKLNSNIKGDDKYFLELLVTMENIYLGVKGTIDFASYKIQDNNLHIKICDLKFGKNVEVSAYKNFQLSTYLIGFYQSLVKEGLNFDKVSAELQIIQPYVSEEDNIWLIPDVKTFINNIEPKFKKACELALNIDSPIIPSEKACQWCKVKPFCPALTNLHNSVSKLKDSFKGVNIESLSEQHLINILDRADEVEMFIKSVKNYVKSELDQGKKIGNYKLIDGRKTRKYLPNAEKILHDLLGEKCYEKSLLGVTKMEKLVSKDVINEICEKVSNTRILIKDDTKFLLRK